MSCLRRAALVVLLFIFFFTVAAPARAQHRPSMLVPNAVFMTSAVADWTSTAYCSYSAWRCNEDNPVYGWIMEPAGRTGLITLGAAVDVGGLWLWNRYVGRSHPRLAKAGLYAASVFRVGVAVRNVQQGRLNRQLHR